MKASMGHVRDLPKKTLGVDVKQGFQPDYEVLPTRKKVLDELKAAAKGAEAIYLAADPDREGEAICWHLSEALGVARARRSSAAWSSTRSPGARSKRPSSNPTDIDERKVDAQQARRILDRLVGYKVSPAALGEGAPRALRRARAVGGAQADLRPRARDPRLRARGVLDGHREPARRRSRPSSRPTWPRRTARTSRSATRTRRPRCGATWRRRPSACRRSSPASASATRCRPSSPRSCSRRRSRSSASR